MRPARETERRARSLPASQCFPRDLELVGLPTQRPLQLPDLPTQLLHIAALLLAGERAQAALEQLLPPRVVQRLRDPLLPADLPRGPIAAQPGKHDLQLLLRRPAPVLPLLAQPSLLLGRAAHPEPAAGQSLRRYAPPGLPGEPKASGCQRATGERGTGNIRADQDGKPLAGPKELPPTQIGKVTIYKEDEPPTVAQHLAVKGLLTVAGILYDPGQEGHQIPALLQRLKDLASRSGGPPPLPEPPNVEHIDGLLSLGGNQLFRAVADDHDRLSQDLARWSAVEQQREKRESQWQDLQRLLRHAESLPIAGTVESAASAIHQGRQLLDDPDPLAPLLDELTDALRNELKQRAEQLASAQRDAVEQLEDWGEWDQLDAAKRQSIIEVAKLVPAGTPDVSTDAKLLEALDAIPLSGWQDLISLVPARRDQAWQHAAMELEPESVRVTPPSASLKTLGDLNAYLEDLRAQVQPHLDADKTVII